MATFITYKNKKGEKRYRFKVYLGTDLVTGKRIETSRQGFKTKKEAQIALNRLQIEFKENKYKTNRHKFTFNDVYKRWYATYKNTVKETTAHVLAYRYDKYFKDDLGGLLIEKITSDYIQKYINSFSEKIFSYKKLFEVVIYVFNYAYHQGIIENNPLSRVVYPKPCQELKHKKVANKSNFYNKNELIYMLNALKNYNKQLYTIIRLLSFTGMRINEALALKWSDISFVNKEIKVDKTLAYDKLSNKMVVNTPKTKTSKRIIDVDDNTMLDLEKLKMKQPTNNLNLVFANNKGGYIRYTSVALKLKQFYKAHDEIKQITLHGFRHTHASLLFEAGLPMKDVQVRLGHSNIQTTMNIYTHVTQQHQKTAVDKFSNFMNF